MRILFLDLDTLRPDHLGCYGYHRSTSPNIDRVAAEGVRFDNYYCSDAPCLPSRAALMTGQFGIQTGVVGHGGTAADPRLEGKDRGFQDTLGDPAGQSLPMIFRRAGMRTVTISPFAERHSAWWFNAGFNEVHNAGKCGNESAEDVTPTVLKWIEENGEEDDWLLHINYWDPHTSYRVPEEFGNPFENDPLPEWITQELVDKHQQSAGPHSAREIMMYHGRPDPNYPRMPGALNNLDDARKLFDGYDCGIRYMDEHIGQIFAALEAKGLMEDLMIVITSDHGENLGELGIYAEHGTADEITCRVPLIIRGPGAQAGHVDKGFHYTLDLGATFAGLLGQEPHPRWEGESFAAAITQGTACGRDSLVLSQCAHVCQRSVRFGPYLYMRTYHDGYHLFPEEMLFNIESDPHEQHNLAGERPGLCREAVYRLNAWHDGMMRTLPDAVDPLWTVLREGGPFHARGHLAAYCERLEATDRKWAAEELKKRHPGEFA